VSGTVNLLNAAREKKVKRFIMASSSSVYGNNPELPKKESFYPNPLSPYAVSKLSGEYYLKVFSELYSMETIAIRYFNVFGPRQDPNSQYAAVIPKFINAIINDEQPIIYGDGYQSRDFTYIENVVEANILAATKKINGSSLIVNCATHSRITLNELVEFINKYLGKEIKPLYTKEREGDVKHSFADITKISKELGYVVKVSFEEGLAKTIEYYLRQNGNR
jgi:nucleoside-diphosphate-sugar epimerase